MDKETLAALREASLPEFAMFAALYGFAIGMLAVALAMQQHFENPQDEN